MKSFAFVAAIGAALSVSAPAAAQAAVEGRPVIIPTAGLNLATAAGRTTLDARIRAAAFAACDASPADLRAQNRAARCRADLTAAARAQRDTLFAHRGGGTMLAARR